MARLRAQFGSRLLLALERYELGESEVEVILELALERAASAYLDGSNLIWGAYLEAMVVHMGRQARRRQRSAFLRQFEAAWQEWFDSDASRARSGLLRMATGIDGECRRYLYSRWVEGARRGRRVACLEALARSTTQDDGTMRRVGHRSAELSQDRAAC